MPELRFPGVLIEEMPALPPTVEPVATAVPVFLGYALAAEGVEMPVRIGSLPAFEELFGPAPVEGLSIRLERSFDRDGGLVATELGWEGPEPGVPGQLLHHALRLYFANGGGPCLVHAMGAAAAPQLADFLAALEAIEAVEGVTLVVFPDAVRLSAGDHAALTVAAMALAARRRDRFVILDVPDALPGGTDTVERINTRFRDRLAAAEEEALQYAAAYFPYLRTALPWAATDATIRIAVARERRVLATGGRRTLEDPALSGKTLAETGLAEADPALHAEIRAFAASARVTLPPSVAVAGIYARMDRERGVWTAPANVALAEVLAPAVEVTPAMAEALWAQGIARPVNVIRSFTGRGVLVWGARTLAGEDPDGRYVSQRRFLIFVEQSLARALAGFVFEPNDPVTWAKARKMVDGFLINLWRQGALLGQTADEAFFVAVGLGETMTPEDVAAGRIVVLLGIAILRPAEFTLLQITQKVAS